MLKYARGNVKGKWHISFYYLVNKHSHACYGTPCSRLWPILSNESNFMLRVQFYVTSCQLINWTHFGFLNRRASLLNIVSENCSIHIIAIPEYTIPELILTRIE